MRLTLERDNGDKHAIVIDGEPTPGNRLDTLNMMAKLLHAWAIERDKTPIEGDKDEDKDNGC
jgi:hypothetical protein